MWFVQFTLGYLIVLQYCDGERFTFCKSNNKDFDNCLKRSMQEAIKLLKDDIPEYNLTNLKVVRPSKVTIQAGVGAVQLIQNYKNVEITGYLDAVVKEAHFDTNQEIFNFTVTIPQYIQKADYWLDGNVLAMPVVGSGPSVLQLDNLEMKHILQLEKYTKSDKTYYKIKSYDLHMSITKAHLRFDNMFGNKMLSDNLNTVLNENWETLFNDTKSSIEEAVIAVLKPYIQTFFNEVPTEELF
ncbi:uncharacterized protein LOC115887561 [Sitophilus oryzae]|uniref:Uncharacterized protein LOC115887561 n=1 Tax=Sitophilus oryzae TaxID=7048 RepID=A0A6J2YIC2_SITOR|nr:uncharacterized protein LOC115887561 [Sitophilus oryzae]